MTRFLTPLLLAAIAATTACAGNKTGEDAVKLPACGTTYFTRLANPEGHLSLIGDDGQCKVKYASMGGLYRNGTANNEITSGK